MVLEAVDASCTDTGLTEGLYCDMCGTVFVEQQIVEATGHEERVVEGYPETCTTDGLTEGSVCGICGEELVVQEVIPAAGHVPMGDVFEQAPNCIADGSREYSCGTCGEYITEILPMDPNAHTDYDGDGICDLCQNVIN